MFSNINLPEKNKTCRYSYFYITQIIIQRKVKKDVGLKKDVGFLGGGVFFLNKEWSVSPDYIKGRYSLQIKTAP